MQLDGGGGFSHERRHRYAKFVAYEDPLTLFHVGQSSTASGSCASEIKLGEIDHGQQDLERDVFVAPGGATLVRADLFSSLHGFDPLITLLGEDLDLCWRAQVAGARIVVAPLAKVGASRNHRDGRASDHRARHPARQPPGPLAPTPVAPSSPRAGTVERAWWTPARPLRSGLAWSWSWPSWVATPIGRVAIAGSWRWLLKHRRRVRQRRRQMRRLSVSFWPPTVSLASGWRAAASALVVTLVPRGVRPGPRYLAASKSP